MTEERDSRGDTIYGVVVGLLYVLAVGVQVFVVVDEMSHGALTADVARRWRIATARWADRRRIDAAVKKWTPWVLYEAHQAVADAEGQTP